MADAARSSNTPALAAQWVIFSLGREDYGVAATQVQEIARHAEITHVPGMPKFVKGVINLRGKIVPILDIKERFQITLAPDVAGSQRIIVAVLGEQLIGLIVDAVSGVIRIPNASIEPVPPTLPKMDAEYLLGVGKVGQKLVVLLNIERMLNDFEKRLLKNAELPAQP